MNEIRYEEDGTTVQVVLARQRGGNALSAEIVEALHAALDRVEAGPARRLVLSAEGKGFCAGLDLSALESENDASLLHRLVRIELLLQRVHRLPLETVALAHGFVYGAGADLFAACQLRIADPGASFRFPGVRFGIALGTRRLAQRVGADRALALLRGDGALPASAAVEAGLVTEMLARDAWPERLAALREGPAPFDRRITGHLLDRVAGGFAAGEDGDLAALVRSAAAPGLKDRIAAYVAEVRRAGAMGGDPAGTRAGSA
ncbi:enoyl-CoA hydratase/isomerase family protein [Acidimangrovimonas sediminis]|uniref:enoyl-CoA hydratase/isomerase family protein n=1 Tax=Acidimangrovimonas sediminis TaxID=2056283 RepID=UPI0018EB4956|nr:enoyl-CoA hydratase/isomerase family protein [Acidimangrovimonas sediminis]